MAPTPTDNQPSAHPTSTSTPPPKAWNTGTIVLGAVFLGFIVVFLTSLIIYITRRRAARNKLHPEMRSRSYHPFRTASTDKAALLANVSPNGGDNNERRKISMFSHERHTSVSLYVDTDAVDQRVSRDRLIPLHTTLSEEETGSLTQGSTGSGVSGGTSRHSGGTVSTASTSGGLSPEGESGSLGTRAVTRPRSTSTTSSRYYAITSPKNNAAPTIPPIPTIPTIIHTVSP